MIWLVKLESFGEDLKVDLCANSLELLNQIAEKVNQLVNQLLNFPIRECPMIMRCHLKIVDFKEDD